MNKTRNAVCKEKTKNFNSLIKILQQTEKRITLCNAMFCINNNKFTIYPYRENVESFH